MRSSATIKTACRADGHRHLGHRGDRARRTGSDSFGAADRGRSRPVYFCRHGDRAAMVSRRALARRAAASSICGCTKPGSRSSRWMPIMRTWLGVPGAATGKAGMRPGSISAIVSPTNWRSGRARSFSSKEMILQGPTCSPLKRQAGRGKHQFTKSKGFSRTRKTLRSSWPRLTMRPDAVITA